MATIAVLFYKAKSPPRWRRIASQKGRAVLWLWVLTTLGRGSYHCAAAYAGVVYEPTQHGIKSWLLVPYVGLHRRLSSAVVLECGLMSAPSAKRKTHWVKSVLRWSSAGLLRPDDCVGQVIRMLANAGVSVPRRCSSPESLKRWLIARGGKHVCLERSPAGGSGDGEADDRGDLPTGRRAGSSRPAA